MNETILFYSSDSGWSPFSDFHSPLISPSKPSTPTTKSDSTSTSSSSLSSTASASAFQLQLHLPALDGVRVLLTASVVLFHTFLIHALFTTAHQHTQFNNNYITVAFIKHFVFAVDALFVLSGFLTAYPLFVKQRLVKRHNDRPKLFAVIPYIRNRISRFLPTMICALVIARVFLFPNNTIAPLSNVHNEQIVDMVTRAYPEASELPLQCSLLEITQNLLFANNHFPEGGCVGWMWSAALQVQFSMLFAVLWARNRQSIAGLMLDVARFVVVSLCFRLLAFLRLLASPIFHVEGFTMNFIIYAHLLTRGGVLFVGVIVAYLVTCEHYKMRIQRILDNCSLLLWTGAAVSVAILSYAVSTQCTDARCDAESHMLETVQSMYHNTIYASHSSTDAMSLIAYAVWFTITPFVIASIYALQLLLILLSQDKLTTAIRQFLSYSFFHRLDRYSYSIYVLHCLIHLKLFSYLIQFHPSLFQASLSKLVFLHLLSSFFIVACAVLVYHCVERPVTRYLQLLNADCSVHPLYEKFTRYYISAIGIWSVALTALIALILIFSLGLHSVPLDWRPHYFYQTA